MDVDVFLKNLFSNIDADQVRELEKCAIENLECISQRIDISLTQLDEIKERSSDIGDEVNILTALNALSRNNDLIEVYQVVTRYGRDNITFTILENDFNKMKEAIVKYKLALEV